MDTNVTEIFEMTASNHILIIYPMSPIYLVTSINTTVVSQAPSSPKPTKYLNRKDRTLKKSSLNVTFEAIGDLILFGPIRNFSFSSIIGSCFEDENLDLFFLRLSESSPFFQYVDYAASNETEIEKEV